VTNTVEVPELILKSNLLVASVLPAVPPWFIVTEPVPVRFTVGVPVVEKLVIVAEFQITPVLPVKLIAEPLPNAIDLTAVPVEANTGTFNVFVPNANVPAVNVNELDVKLSPNVSVWLGPLNVIGEEAIVTAFVVTVPVPTNVILPVADHVVVADSVIAPLTFNVPVEDSVHVAPVVVNDLQTGTPVNVTVGEPELASIIVLSTNVGAKTPPEPPEVFDQLVVVDASQVPLPPTQYSVRSSISAMASEDHARLADNVAARAVDVPAAACNSSAINTPVTDAVDALLTRDVVDAFAVQVVATIAQAYKLIT
jgi:hypothetical protein